MATDPRKRQKKLQRRAAHQKSKHMSLMRQKSAGLPGQLTAAAGCPIIDCLATMDLWDQGMGWIILSRQLPNGAVAFAMFLVDRYCLGVKNANANIGSRFDYNELILNKVKSQYQVKTISPADARRIVESAVTFARNLGFRPHADCQRACLLFGSIDPAQATEELEFGKDGKPMFISGPFDNAARCREILATLERSCGPGGFEFFLPMKPVGGNALEPPEEELPLMDEEIDD